jgi:formylmethanofuran dehydrogenase subunit E
MSYRIRSYTFEDFGNQVRLFHGSIAPGIMIGGFMVDLAYQNLPADSIFDSISETAKCLPDAVQLLTPCTIGNRWLRIINVGRFALAFYDKYSGEGVRIQLDYSKLNQWPEINTWFFKLIPKKEQNSQSLLAEIKEAGTTILTATEIKVKLELLVKKATASVPVCPVCNKVYQSADGFICPDCCSKILPYA